MGNDQSFVTRSSTRRTDKVKEKLFYEKSDVSEFILEKILDDCTSTNWEKTVREGSDKLRKVHRTHEDLLDFNANREKKKLEKVLEAMKKHRNNMADQMVGTVGVEVIKKELEEHNDMMDKLTKQGHMMARIYAEYLQEATMQVNAVKEMSIEEKIKMREAREMDLMEETYQRKVQDVRKQIQKLKMLKEKLESTMSEADPSSMQGYHSTYLDYIIERIRLSLMIFERDVQDLIDNKLSTAREAGREILKCVEKGNDVVVTICALESDRETLETEAIHLEIRKLVDTIAKLEEVGARIPEVKVNNHLKKLLEQHRKAEKSGVLTLFLVLFLVILVYLWMNI